MPKLLPNPALLGRLYEPLLGLATRIHRALGTRPKTIWTDAGGGVYTIPIDRPASKPPRSIIGTYDANTSRDVIERDLRLALRERACCWITDWNVKPLGAPQARLRPKAGATAQGRSRRGRAAMTGMPKQDPIAQELHPAGR